jgi:hypothetical protein
MRKAKKNKLSKEEREAQDQQIHKLIRVLDEVTLTPPGQALDSFLNSQVREKTLAKIMRRRFGNKLGGLPL